ncbi:protein artichoke [Prorops nasuta]|uniref:protein artichoke n=1 Tax=Prorops nasuta TaxID=863751 RepID=UPI0034CEAD65
MMQEYQGRIGVACSASRRYVLLLLKILLIEIFALSKIVGQSIKCPPIETIPACLCYSFDDGLYLECAGATEEALKSTLQNLTIFGGSEMMVQSLSVYEFDRNIEELKDGSFPPGVQIRHLQISHSSLRNVRDDALANLKDHLESLALVTGRLPQVPQKAFSNLKKLAALDLEANLIQDLSSYCFYGLSLMKLSLKSNQISKISEYAFAGLEDILSDLDLTENKLKLFPMTSLRRLESLKSLRLAWNEISEIFDDGYSQLKSLLILDLSNNNFVTLTEDCFRPFPVLRTLSLYYNSIEVIHKDAFLSLKNFESIDLSHNKIVVLDIATFKANEKLRIIELSHNHIHYINGVFARLPELTELYLSENNILEIPSNAFLGSVNLTVIYLQQNAIRRIDAKGLVSLTQLTELHLSNNYIEKMPREFLKHCENLSSLSLDGNKLRELQLGTFHNLNQLRELRLQDNLITEIKRRVLAPLPALLELHLQNNIITDIETGALSTLSSLQHINLQGNLLRALGDVFQISTLDKSFGGSSLVSIQLESNHLSTLHNDSLRGQASVRIMWLGHNKLTNLKALLFRDLLLVERLYLKNNSISNIEDSAFKSMQALKFLELSMNKLTNITAKTFSELHELEELYLQDNGLKSIDPYALMELKKLKVLDLANNNLHILQNTTFQKNLPITKLNLNNCSITMIENGSFIGLNNLLDLNLNDNLLTAKDLLHLQVSELQLLAASGNNFTDIREEDLIGLPSLRELFLNNAYINKLPERIFALNQNLTKLHLDKNLLSMLLPGTFHGLLSLRELYLDSNQFRDIPYSALANALNLEILTLSNNKITNVDIASLSSLKYLRELDLSHNQIETISGFLMANLSRLISVDLSNNQLYMLPSNFFLHSSILRRVDLSNNKFQQIPATALSDQNLPNLVWLNLTRNPLNRIHDLPSEVIYSMLQEIHISKTNLSIVTSQDFEAFPALLHLFLNQNRILRVSPGAFRSLTNLLTLHLGLNSLEILPKERLQGIEHLRILNLTHNRLKKLEEFPKDLKSLQVLDLSYNQISIVGKVTFKNLISLVELHLYGNWINTISSEAFKPLKKLRLLDLSRNYLENLPLNAFRPLETQIRSLRAEENPLHCGCESQEMWEWLRDHQKLVGGVNKGRNDGKSVVGISDMKVGLLRCEQPPELRGLVFLDLDPHAFCSAPLIIKLAIQDIQPFSVLVSWQSRNHSSLHGYQVVYRALDNSDEVRGKLLDTKARSVRLTKLVSETRYLICVLGLGSWSIPLPETTSWQPNATHDDIIEDTALSAMVNSPTSKCTEVKTLDAPNSIVGDGSVSDRGGLASILTRRLGLIVGSCMGFVVFLILISVLSYIKLKKQRAAIKREQPVPSNTTEFLSYRHFSLQSGDRSENPYPSFISNISVAPPNS